MSDRLRTLTVGAGAWPLTRAAPAALILLLTAVALALILGAPPSRTIDVGTPGDGYFAVNFYGAERAADTDFRWSGPGARLLLHAPLASPSALELRMHAFPGAGPALPLAIGRAGQDLARLTVETEWRVYRILLPPGDPTLELDTPTLRPGPNDPRDLGFALDRVTLARPWQSGPAWVWALSLVWLLALATGLAWLADAAATGAAGIHTRPWRIALVTAALAAVLLLWAIRDPYLLAWFIPPDLRLPTLLTLVLVVAGGLVALLRRMPAPPLPAGASGIIVLLHLLLLPGLPTSLRGLAALLLAAAPGALGALALFRHERDPLARLFLALCGGIALLPLLLLALHALPGGVPWWMLLAALDGAAGVALLVLRQISSDGIRSDFSERAKPSPGLSLVTGNPTLLLILILALAAALRLTFLGGSEFQGDEARALHLAAGVLHGREQVLVLHTKGPVEALLPGVALVLTGTINEFVARLPFALAGLGVLLGIFLVSRTLFDEEQGVPGTGVWAGLIAALFLAIDGFLVGFGRMVQYQSVVMLMMAGAFWCCWRFYAGASPPLRYLSAAALFAATGVLSHYDAAAVLPALAWLVIVGAWRRGWRGGRLALALGLPATVGVALLAAFYLPFVLNTRFARTAEYLFGRTRQDDAIGSFFNSLPGYYRLVTFYSSTYQIHLLALLLAMGLCAWLVLYVRPRPLAWLLTALWLTGCTLLVLDPTRFLLPGGYSWAIAAFAPPLLALLLAPATPAPLRAALLWFAVPFTAMSFLIADPRTHYYTMHLAGTLLAALVLVRFGGWLATHRLGWLRLLLSAATTATLTLGTFYAQLAFVRPFPEYQRSFPAARLELFRATYDTTLPEGGFFGFVHRDGLKVVGELLVRGQLAGAYDSNQKDHITGWYTRAAPLCAEQPALYFTAYGEPNLVIPEGYQLLGEVWSGPRRALAIFSHEPPPGPPQRFDFEELTTAFDTRPVDAYPLSPFLYEVVPEFPLEAEWINGARLRGYDLDRATIAHSSTTHLSLYWQARTRFDPDFTPLIEITNHAGQKVGEVTPVCGLSSLTAWPTREVNPLDFVIGGLAPGEYTLYAGLRDKTSGNWLLLDDGTATVMLARLTVQGALE